MTINDEVEQIIIRTILRKGYDAIPKDWSFINKYDIKDLYFISIDLHSIVSDDPSRARIIKKVLKEKLEKHVIETGFPLLQAIYARGGKSKVISYLKEEAYFQTFYKSIRNGK